MIEKITYGIEKMAEILKYHIVTYGCQMNTHESEKIAGVLEDFHYVSTDVIEEADVVVFNTCCIRENAEQRAEGNIGKMKPLKKINKDIIVAVCGCMTQQDGAAKRLSQKFPFIDIIFGTHNLDKFAEFLAARLAGKKRIIAVDEKEGAVTEGLSFSRTSYPNAWVNIMYGCNNFCTYCIVPYVRGRERSRKMENVLSEIRSLVQEGYREITLLGQNVNSYGKDLNDGSSFAALIREMGKIEGNYWVRFMTSHPKDLSEEVVLAIRDNPHMCKSIHLPVQAGSDEVLRRMNRKYTSADYLKRVEMIRSYLPDCTITSDLMVGFPGETDEDFEDTMKLVRKVRYSNAFTFVYSRRKGTVADKMEDQVPESVKRERIMRLIDLQNGITREISKSYENKECTILCEDYDDKKDLYLGRNEYGHMVYFTAKENMIGKFLKVKIHEVGGISLFGDLVEETVWLSRQ